LISPENVTYEYDDDPARIDHEAVWLFMSTQAYWGRWRSREVVHAQIRASWRVVGVYEKPGAAMVGFARAVSDGFCLAYLADVYIRPEHRGQGLGVELVRRMIDGGPGAHFRWMLHTGDAHGLYAKCGFIAPDPTYLERAGGPRATGTPTVAEPGS
jgi:GNAT superfamily N-acetyltransferase